MQNNMMHEFVCDLLVNKLPENYTYHNLGHTLYVTEKAAGIGREENCSEAELRLINAAALWHDTGFILKYKGHEKESCNLAEKYLPQFDFSPAEIEQIKRIIMATEFPQNPHDKCGNILADADLEYLGTADASLFSGYLFAELLSLKKVQNIKDWNKIQIAFLKQHRYHTHYCRENKERNKQLFLEKLIRNMPDNF
jgi:uncharacterized protein